MRSSLPWTFLVCLSTFVLLEAEAQRMPFNTCPASPAGWPVSAWNFWHLPAGHQVKADLGSGTVLSIDCLSGNIFDEYSGNPNFQLLLSAPKVRAQLDLTPYVKDNSLLGQGIWLDASFVVEYLGTNTSVLTDFQLIFINQNGYWNADFNFTLTYALDGATPAVAHFDDHLPEKLLPSQDNDEKEAMEAMPHRILLLVHSIQPLSDKTNREQPFFKQANSSVSVLAQPSQQSSQQPCVQSCTPQGNISLAQCSWYRGQSWLPWSYAAAASCACTLQGLPGQMSPTANCVRSYLLAAHQGDSYFSEAEKANYAGMFSQECNKFPNPGSCVMGNYYNAVINQMVPKVYQMHVNAYKTCCCPGSPASKPHWYMIFFGFLESFVWTNAGCSLEVQQIEKRGPCGCDGW